MDVPIFESNPMYYDNKSVIQIDHNLLYNECIKHIEIDCHFIPHHLQYETITLPFVSSPSKLLICSQICILFLVID